MQLMSIPGICPTRSREEDASGPDRGTNIGTWHQTTLHNALIALKIACIFGTVCAWVTCISRTLWPTPNPSQCRREAFL